jgi:diguanylate cyclase (GGDEF)-like protein
MTSQGRLPSAALAVVSVVIVFLVPVGGAPWPFLYTAVELSAVAAIVLVAAPTSTSAAARRSWWLLALGLMARTLGDVAWQLFDLRGLDPFPSVADVAYLAAYPFLAAGLMVRVRERSGGRDTASMIDATIVALGTGVVAWVFLMQPYATDPALSTAEKLLSTAYPMGDVLLVAVAARLTFVPGRRSPTDSMLIGVLLILLVGDVAYAYRELFLPAGARIDVDDLAFLWAHALVVAAALHPASGLLQPSVRTADGELSRGRLLGLAVASLLAPAVLAVRGVRADDVSLLVIAAGSAVLFVLVLVRMERLVQQVQRQSVELHRLATTDGLTGLANRRYWQEDMPRELARSSRDASPACVAILDLDHFKRFNDRHGHTAGDDLLRRAGAAWRAALRPGDVLARWGGEEFALFLPATTPARAAEVLARLRAATPLDQDFSAGIASWDGVESLDELVARADAALYAAKHAGRGRTIEAPLPDAQASPAPVP